MARTELPPRHPFNPFYPERVIVTPIRKPLRKIAATCNSMPFSRLRCHLYRTRYRGLQPANSLNYLHRDRMKDAMTRSQKRMSISISPADRALIESAAESAGVSAAAWIVHAAREEARWAVACQITGELAAEVGVTADDLAWATSVLGVDTHGFCKSVTCRHLPHKFG
jgi:hypothetical protein